MSFSCEQPHGEDREMCNSPAAWTVNSHRCPRPNYRVHQKLKSDKTGHETSTRHFRGEVERYRSKKMRFWRKEKTVRPQREKHARSCEFLENNLRTVLCRVLHYVVGRENMTWVLGWKMTWELRFSGLSVGGDIGPTILVMDLSNCLCILTTLWCRVFESRTSFINLKHWKS